MVVKNGTYNHELETDLLGHAFVRRVTPEQEKLVFQMSTAGEQTKCVLATLRQQYPDVNAISRTIYDLRAKKRRIDPEDRTPIQALLHNAREVNFYTSLTLDDEGHVTRLFFAHPKSVELLQIYHKVLLTDCTDRYKIPFQYRGHDVHYFVFLWSVCVFAD